MLICLSQPTLGFANYVNLLSINLRSKEQTSLEREFCEGTLLFFPFSSH